MCVSRPFPVFGYIYTCDTPDGYLRSGWNILGGVLRYPVELGTSGYQCGLWRRKLSLLRRPSMTSLVSVCGLQVRLFVRTVVLCDILSLKPKTRVQSVCWSRPVLGFLSVTTTHVITGGNSVG